jgi:hypothetical protein
MMPMEVACPSCGVKLGIPEEFIGKQVRCAACSTVFEAMLDSLPAIHQPLPSELPQRQPPQHVEHDAVPGERVHDEYDENYDRDEDWESRRIRRDLAPHRGSLILGLGVGSVVGSALAIPCCALPAITIPLGAVSWIMGASDLRKIDAGDMDPDGRGNTKAGYICGIIGLVLGIVVLLGWGVYFAWVFWLVQNAMGPNNAPF